MGATKQPYAPEFRARIVELARSDGRTMRSISQEYGVTETTIRSWLRQADRDEGRRSDGLTTDEKAELARLRREVKTLREEREILSKAAAWFAQEVAPTSKRRSDS